MLEEEIRKVGLTQFNAETIVAFANTGKEMPQTLDFVNECATRWGVPVVWLEYHRVPARSLPAGVFPTPRRNQNLAKAAAKDETVHWFKQVDYKTASRTGAPFAELLDWMSVLPNVVSRGCSMQLKIRTVMRYLFSLGIKEYAAAIGIRFDEAFRANQILLHCDNYEKPYFPLISAKVAVADVMDFWRQSPFDLQLRSYQGNCDPCFLKSKGKIIQMIRDDPSCVEWWNEQEAKKAAGATGRGAVFNRSHPFTHFEALAKTEEEFPFQGSDDIACSCAERAFDGEEADEEGVYAGI